MGQTLTVDQLYQRLPPAISQYLGGEKQTLYGNVLPSLELTAILPLKMDGSKMRFLLGFGFFSHKILVQRCSNPETMINISSGQKHEKDVDRIQTRKSDVSINLLRPWTSINPTNPTYPATNQPTQPTQPTQPNPPNLQNVNKKPNSVVKNPWWGRCCWYKKPNQQKQLNPTLTKALMLFILNPTQPQLQPNPFMTPCVRIFFQHTTTSFGRSQGPILLFVTTAPFRCDVFGGPDLIASGLGGLWNLCLKDHPRYRKWLGSPPFISHKARPFARGPTTRSLGDLRSPWLLTTYIHRDDPPSGWKKKVGSCTWKLMDFNSTVIKMASCLNWMMGTSNLYLMEKWLLTHQTSIKKIWLFEFQAIETENFLAGRMVDQCIITSKTTFNCRVPVPLVMVANYILSNACHTWMSQGQGYFFGGKTHILNWSVVSTHLKNISQMGSFPQVGVNIKNVWNHH